MWDERYKQEKDIPREPEPLLVEWVRSVAPGHALDLACGAGRNSIFLAANGWTVDAIDSSSAGLHLLKKRSEGLPVRTHLADLEYYDLPPETYDLVCNFHYLQRSLFPRIASSLKSGGVFLAVISMQDSDPGIKPMNPEYLLAPGELPKHFPEWVILRWEKRKAVGSRRYCAFAARKP
ncbi:MAG TPA: methyltransferase domain-containing protein [Bryobacteraceae bacterium]|nr:methyltransferase domain-containing protein [Bryobacteraceae bacterium]